MVNSDDFDSYVRNKWVDDNSLYSLEYKSENKYNFFPYTSDYSRYSKFKC